MDDTLRYSSLSTELTVRVSIDAMPARDKIELLRHLIIWATPEDATEYHPAADVVFKAANRFW